MLQRLLLLLTCVLIPLSAADTTTTTVGIKQAPPFVFLDAQQRPSGITIELWELVARELQLDSRYQDYDLSGLLGAVKAGQIDVAAAALTVTEARESQFDFTHSFFSTGLGIATRSEGNFFSQALRMIVEPYFLGALGVLSLLLLSIGALIWLLERKANPEQFGRPGLGGLSDGFWWSAVTMTTVGYGDKAPRTPVGRLIAIWWMFASIFLISGFSATIASSLTASHYDTAVSSPADLYRVQVGVVSGATSESYARDTGLQYAGFPDLDTALAALQVGTVTAVIHDRPLLRYLVRDERVRGVSVLPHMLRNEEYAFAVPSGSPLREDINRALLKIVERGDFAAIVRRYLGTDDA